LPNWVFEKGRGCPLFQIRAGLARRLQGVACAVKKRAGYVPNQNPGSKKGKNVPT